jgi:hypothetical protein
MPIRNAAPLQNIDNCAAVRSTTGDLETDSWKQKAAATTVVEIYASTSF